jgi:2-polyprenyl-3-methyl-5-hydroxy-6-metoxy-1,4-benzoquinol methylase
MICPLCKKNNTKTLYFISKNIKIFKCKNDGLVFSKTVSKKRKKGKKEKKEKNLYPYHQALIQNYFYNKLTTINNYLLQTNITVLDIGSGWGDFLKILKKENIPYLGLEKDKQKLKKLKQQNLNCKAKTLSQLIKEKQKFEAITCFQVIEHIKNPIPFLKQIKTLLTKKGIIIITTPNYNSPLRKIKKQNWSVYNYPDHHLFFTKKALKQTLIKAGFKNKNIKIKLDQPRFFNLNYILKRLGVLKNKNYLKNIPIPTDPFGDIKTVIKN